MFEFNRQIIRYIDSARTQPKNCAKKIINNFQAKFNGTQFNAFGKIIDTFEGIQALKDLQSFLNKSLPINSLIHSKTLDKAAQIIAEQKGKQGKTQNEKPKLIYQKIQKFGQVKGKIGQLISLVASLPQQIASYFIIDDGLTTRKRRRMLLDPTYKYIGVGHAAHKQHQFITVILLAQNLQQKDNYFLENQRLNEQIKMQIVKQAVQQNSVKRQSSIRQSNFY